jgi:DNA-binding HxlR family transcriptional regulator
VLCRRWKAAILWLLAREERRYTALARRLSRVTPKVLTEQLRALERDGLVRRATRPRGPKHVEYALTPAGDALRPLLQALVAWAREYDAFIRTRDEADRLHRP